VHSAKRSCNPGLSGRQKKENLSKEMKMTQSLVDVVTQQETGNESTTTDEDRRHVRVSTGQRTSA